MMVHASRSPPLTCRNKQVLDYNRKLFAYFVDPNQDGKLDDGVDGFRLDHCMDNLDGKPELTHLFSDFWSVLLNDLKRSIPNSAMWPSRQIGGRMDWTISTGRGVDRVFGFGLQRAILSFNKQELSEQTDKLLAQCPTGKEQVIFIENHDMDRFASLEKNPDKQKLAATLMLLIGGVPSIYYGQELGMTGKGAVSETMMVMIFPGEKHLNGIRPRKERAWPFGTGIPAPGGISPT